MTLEQVKTNTTWNEASSRINSNNAKIAVELTKLGNATYKNKGYFKTLSQLQEAYPSSSEGSRAYVGTRYPYAIYLWESGGWSDSGETGGDESLDLSQYYTKAEVEAKIASYHEVLPQAMYDILAEKEDKFYFTTEGGLDIDTENGPLEIK